MKRHRFGIFAARLSTAFAMLVIASSLGQAQQQPQPSQGAIDMAREIVVLKGGDKIFSPLIPGVIEQGKNMFLQQNPALQRDLNEVATKLRSDFEPRKAEVMTAVARTYASHFTEAELKEILTFYRSPVGKKVIDQEVRVLGQSASVAQEWAVKFSDEVISRMRAEMKKKGHDL
ncbi:MAG: DUF2059 domain-containing protein [Pseudolabrys sp.]